MIGTLIVVWLIVILGSAYALGGFTNTVLNLGHSRHWNVIVGLVSLFALAQLPFFFVVYFQWPSAWMFGFEFLIIVLPYAYYFKRPFSRRKPSLHSVLWIAVVLILGLWFSKQTLGSFSFDSSYYLTMMLDNAYSTVFNHISVDSGLETAYLNPQYAFQAYYSFGSFIIVESRKLLVLWGNQDLIPLMPVTIWVLSMLYLVFNTHLVLNIARAFRFRWVAFWLIILLGYWATLYYNSAFAFFGNTWRTALVAFLSYEIYRLLKLDSLSVFHYVWLAIIDLALISVSSTGFFIGAMMLFGFVVTQTIQTQKFDQDRLIVFVPTFMFSLFYFGANSIFLFLILSISFLVLLLLVILVFYYRKWTLPYGQFQIGLGFTLAIIVIYSVIHLGLKWEITHTFFEDHRWYDMVWYYFGFNEFPLLVINSVIWISSILYWINSRHPFRMYTLIMILFFINPISYAFMYRFLASVVYYRSYEIIFNPFTLILFTQSSFIMIPSEKLRKGIQIGLSGLGIYIMVSNGFKYYHPSFIPTESYLVLEKVTRDDWDVMSYLTIEIEKSKETALMVTQLQQIRSYVPHTTMVISTDILRSIDMDRNKTRPTLNNLTNVFAIRDYIGQEVFDSVPRYTESCDALKELHTQYVLIRRDQFYTDDVGVIVPLSFAVLDCSKVDYQSPSYELFKFSD